MARISRPHVENWNQRKLESTSQARQLAVRLSLRSHALPYSNWPTTEDGEPWLTAKQPFSTCCRRAVGEDANGSAGREAGRGERHVVGENARENVPLFFARHDK
jgi:hypothetical protein